MKKIITLALTLLFVFTLTGCEKVYIEPGIIDVQYDNVRWEEDLLIVDVWITNGTEEDFDLRYMEFNLYFPDEETEFCGAGFDFYDTIKPDNYVMYELEFSDDLIFLTQADLDDEGIGLSDLVLYFWYE